MQTVISINLCITHTSQIQASAVLSLSGTILTMYATVYDVS